MPGLPSCFRRPILRSEEYLGMKKRKRGLSSTAQEEEELPPEQEKEAVAV